MDYSALGSGMQRETAPHMPNQLTPDMYTSLNGDPQTTVRNQIATQQQLSGLATQTSQLKVNELRDVDKNVLNQSQKDYETQRFTNDYIISNMLEAGEAEELMALGMGNPEEFLRILQASNQIAKGMNVA